MKKVLSVLLVTVMLLSMSVPAFAAEISVNNAPSNTESIIENISANIDPERFTLEYVDEIPNGVTPIEFDSWEDAVIWINSNLGSQSQTVTENQSNTPATAAYTSIFPGENYEEKGDIGRITYYGIPEGSGSYSGIVEYDVTGLSAQTVEAHHYFEYSNDEVTDWSVYTSISGFGLATYSVTYEKLERHDVPDWRRYFGVCVGNLGYYIEVSGVPIGVYQALELTYVLYTPK